MTYCKSFINLLAVILLFNCGCTYMEKGRALKIEVGKGPCALFVTPDKRYLYVLNEKDTIISIVDTKSDKVIKKITGIRRPYGFTKLGSSNLVAVSGYDKQVALINFEEHTIVKQQSFGSTLGSIVSSSDGKMIFVTAIAEQKVLQLDANSLEVINSYRTGEGPEGIGISKDNNKLYVTNTGDGSISIINIKTRETLILEIGGKPERINASKDNTKLFISNYLNNEAYVLNTVTDSITHTFEGLNGPAEVMPSEDGKRIYIVNFKDTNGEYVGDSKVYVYDATSYKKLSEEYLVGNRPIDFIGKNSKKAYVSNHVDNSLTVINLK